MSVRGSLGAAETVVNCVTVGVTEVVGSSVGSMGCGDSGTVMSARVSLEVTGSADCLSGIVELDEDSRTVVSAGVSVEVTGSGIIELGDNSGTVVSAGVSITGMLSCDPITSTD